MNNVFLGVPVKLGANGIEEIIELKLHEDELELLKTSEGHVRQVMEVFDNMEM
jgi:malate dehydrogenase